MGKEKKDQYVIACLDSESDADAVLPMACHFAARLGKGLLVLNVSSDGHNEWLKQYGLPYVGLRGDWKTAIDALPTAFGGVVAVTTVRDEALRSSLTNPRTMLRTFADCKIAWLVTGEKHRQSADGQWPSETWITLDHRRESKEKLIWASYMVRFFGSRLTIATPAYSDAGFREKLRNNILFATKMLRPLEVPFTTADMPSSNFRQPDMVLVGQHGKPDAATGLLVAMTTDRRDRDLLDMVAGPTELRLLRQCPSPIMFVNHRDDIYVLCD